MAKRLIVLTFVLLAAIACRPSGAVNTANEIPIDQFDSFKQLYEWKGADGGYSPSVVYYPRQGTEAEVQIAVAFQEKATEAADFAIHLLRISGGDTLQVVDEKLIKSSEEVGGYLALGRLPKSGKLVLAYYNNTLKELHLLTEKNDGSFGDLMVDNQGNVGGFVDLAVDQSDSVHLGYLDFQENNVKYALVQNGKVIIGPRIVDTGNDGDENAVQPGGNISKKVSIAVNALGDPTLSYYEATNSFLRLAHYNSLSDSWQLEVVGRYVEGTLLMPDTSGKAVVGQDFVRRPEQLWLLENGLPVTTNVTILDGRQIVIPDFDPTAEYELSYVMPYSANYGQWSDLVYDGNGTLFVSMFDFQRQLLMVVSNSDPFSNRSWNLAIADTDGSVGDFCQIAISHPQGAVAGIPVLAYYDATNANMRMGFRQKATWRTRAIDTAGWTGLGIGMDAGSDGWLAVAYRVYDFAKSTSTLRVYRSIPVLEN